MCTGAGSGPGNKEGAFEQLENRSGMFTATSAWENDTSGASTSKRVESGVEAPAESLSHLMSLQNLVLTFQLEMSHCHYRWLG